MNKKILISLGIILSLVFSFSICFAADGLGKAADDVRNVVGGVENTVENAAKDVSNASKGATGTVENDMNNDKTTNNNKSSNINTNSNRNAYTTSRVATDDTTLMGMTSNGWTWLIIGIAAIAIIAVVWYYSMQFTNNNKHDDNNRLD